MDEHGHDSDIDSLFGSFASGDDKDTQSSSLSGVMPVLTTRPPIPGFYYDPLLLLSPELCNELLCYLQSTYFSETQSDINQVMLFGRCGSTLPSILENLLDELAFLLVGRIPDDIHSMLFPAPEISRQRSRQAILNKYLPGEGITPHIDLLKRFDDGIIGVSLGSGTVMDFEKSYDKDQGTTWSLYLPPGSVIVLTGESRYQWTHGIATRDEDWVRMDDQDGKKEPVSIKRGTRMSITFRWLLPGADVLI